MRVIAWRTLREFASQRQYKDAIKPLSAWRSLMEKSIYANPHEVNDAFSKASILKNGLVIFNIRGTEYRLVVSIAYRTRIVYVKWIGTHDEYDKLDLG